MLKTIGIIVFAMGVLLTILTIISAKKGGFAEVREELSMILESGYADTHKEARKGARLEEKQNIPSEIKVAPKKRTLSKEAQEILAMVEQEKAAEKASHEAVSKREPAKLSDNTDILNKKRDPARPSSSAPTDILKRGRSNDRQKTDVLSQRKAHDSSGTDILRREGDKTDVMKRQEEKSGDGTDILIRRGETLSSMKRETTDILTRLPEKTEKTDILKKTDPVPAGVRGEKEKTDILSKRVVDSTDILQKEVNTTESGTGILKRRN